MDQARWRRVRHVGMALVFTALLVVATGCAASVPGGATDADEPERTDAVVAITSDAENRFDPTTGWSHGTASLLHSTLVEFDSDRAIVNDLATNYEISADGLTYVFQLRDDAFFSDGVPVTAADVEFTYSTALEKQAQELTNLTEVRATGEREVTFTLTAPNSSLINTIALVGIVPEHAYEEGSTQAPIGSGPWVLTQWIEGEQIMLERNDSYYRELPELENVTILIMAEDAALAAAMAGEVDVAVTRPVLATREIAGMRLEVVETLDGRGITLPMRPDEGETTEAGDPIGNDVTANLAIRRAMAYAVDREAIAEHAVNGFGTPAYSENDGMPWHNPDVVIAQDVAYAQRILSDDGWRVSGDGILEKDGLRAEFNAYYPSEDSTRQAIGLVAAQQLAEVGIQMNVEGRSWADIASLMHSNGVIMGWGMADPYLSYQLFHSSNALKDDFYNPGGFSDPTVDNYLEAALEEQSPKAANELWRLAQWDGTTGTSMRGQAPWLWLVSPSHLYYVAEGLSIGTQHLHGHGESWELMQNLGEWSWN